MKRWITDKLIRRKSTLHKTEIDQYSVRIAKSPKEYAEAFQLVQSAYIFQGIESVGKAGEMRVQPQHMLSEAIVLVAYDQRERLVGTMTVFNDSPAGLPLDKDYSESLNRMRRQGARLVEYGSLAVVRRCSHTGVTHLMNVAANWCRRHWFKASHVVIGIHPKAAAYYRSIYCFESLASAQEHATLVAPVIGLIQDGEKFERFAETTSHFQQKTASGDTVHQWWFKQLPDCIHLPLELTYAQLVRWKLPRETFRDLFVETTNRVAALDAITRQYLHKQRTDNTLHDRSNIHAAPLAKASTRTSTLPFIRLAEDPLLHN